MNSLYIKEPKNSPWKNLVTGHAPRKNGLILDFSKFIATSLAAPAGGGDPRSYRREAGYFIHVPYMLGTKQPWQRGKSLPPKGITKSQNGNFEWHKHHDSRADERNYVGS